MFFGLERKKLTQSFRDLPVVSPLKRCPSRGKAPSGSSCRFQRKGNPVRAAFPTWQHKLKSPPPRSHQSLSHLLLFLATERSSLLWLLSTLCLFSICSAQNIGSMTSGPGSVSFPNLYLYDVWQAVGIHSGFVTQMNETQIPKAWNLISDRGHVGWKSAGQWSNTFLWFLSSHCSGSEITANLQELMWAGNERKRELIGGLYGKLFPAVKSGFGLSNAWKIVG